MHYHHISFVFAFLPLVVLLYYFLQPGFRQGYLMLVSAVWVAVISPLLLLWIGISSVIDFFLAKRLSKSGNNNWYWLGIGLHLAGFAACRLLENVSGMGYERILLFSGLFGNLFYLMNSTGYLTEVKKKQILPTHTYWSYLSYLLFFPKFLAGPWISFRQWAIDWSKYRGNAHWGFRLSGLVLFSFGLAQQYVLVAQLKPLVFNTAVLQEKLSLLGAPAFISITLLLVIWEWISLQWMARGMGRMLDIRLSSGFIPAARATHLLDWFRLIFRPFGAWWKLVLGPLDNPILIWVLGAVIGVMVQSTWTGMLVGGIIGGLIPLMGFLATPSRKWLLILRGALHLYLIGAFFCFLLLGNELPLGELMSRIGIYTWPFEIVNAKAFIALFLSLQLLLIPLFLGTATWYYSWRRPFSQGWYRNQIIILVFLWILLLFQMPLVVPVNQLFSAL